MIYHLRNDHNAKDDLPLLSIDGYAETHEDLQRLVKKCEQELEDARKGFLPARSTLKSFMHKHHFRISEKSNVIQLDDMGYPLRLCIMKCDSCSYSDQQWIDTEVEEDDVILKWHHC